MISIKAQTITYKGCPAKFSNHTYTFTKVGTDGTGRHIFETTPITGDQPCPGLGACEFKIRWNTTNNRWEFIADDGNGDFSNPYLIYHNTSASTPNPPSMDFGIWIENNVITEGQCGGNMTSANTVFTGSVQSTLSTNEFEKDETIAISPNPVTSIAKINSNYEIENITIYSTQGQKIKTVIGNTDLDLSDLSSGMYIVKVLSNKGVKVLNVIKK